MKITSLTLGGTLNFIDIEGLAQIGMDGRASIWWFPFKQGEIISNVIIIPSLLVKLRVAKFPRKCNRAAGMISIIEWQSTASS